MNSLSSAETLVKTKNSNQEVPTGFNAIRLLKGELPHVKAVWWDLLERVAIIGDPSIRVSTRSLAEDLDMGHSQIRYALGRLEAIGFIHKIGLRNRFTRITVRRCDTVFGCKNNTNQQAAFMKRLITSSDNGCSHGTARASAKGGIKTYRNPEKEARFNTLVAISNKHTAKWHRDFDVEQHILCRLQKRWEPDQVRRAALTLIDWINKPLNARFLEKNIYRWIANEERWPMFAGMRQGVR